MPKPPSKDPILARINANRRKRYWANPERARELVRKKRRRAIDRGKCGECAGRSREPGMHTCYECLERHRTYKEREKCAT